MNELYIEKGNYIEKIAYIEDGELRQFDFMDKEVSVHEGDIYKGIVKKIMKGMNSALIDLGSDIFGYLQERDLEKNLKNGQEIIVQIKRRSIEDKHPKLTREISVLGRYVVLLPFSSGINISNKIQDESILNDIKRELNDNDFIDKGVIIRTIANKELISDLKIEINELTKLWNSILIPSKISIGPKILLRQFNLLEKFIMKINPVSIDAVISNDLDTINELKKKLKDKIEIKEYIFKDTTFLLENLGVNKTIKKVFENNIQLKNGVSLYIESMEAFHVIDVNGSRDNNSRGFEKNALDINLSSCNEVVRQIILRDLSGIILVDFIDMKQESNKIKLIKTMKNLFKNDIKKVSVISITELGIMQIIRKRDQEDIVTRYTEKCRLCNGTGRVMSKKIIIEEICQEIKNKISHANVASITLDIPYIYHPDIEKVLRDLEVLYKIKIYARYFKDNFENINIKFQGLVDKE